MVIIIIIIIKTTRNLTNILKLCSNSSALSELKKQQLPKHLTITLLYPLLTLTIISDLFAKTRGMPLSVMVVSRCTHEEDTGTCRRGGKLKLTVFNDFKQGRTRQGKADTDRNTGE